MIGRPSFSAKVVSEWRQSHVGEERSSCIAVSGVRFFGLVRTLDARLCRLLTDSIRTGALDFPLSGRPSLDSAPDSLAWRSVEARLARVLRDALLKAQLEFPRESSCCICAYAIDSSAGLLHWASYGSLVLYRIRNRCVELIDAVKTCVQRLVLESNPPSRFAEVPAGTEVYFPIGYDPSLRVTTETIRLTPGDRIYVSGDSVSPDTMEMLARDETFADTVRMVCNRLLYEASPHEYSFGFLMHQIIQS